MPNTDQELFNVKLQNLIKLMAAKGYPIMVTSNKRTAEQQAKLYAKGRSSGGNIVTEKSGAAGDESLHQLGLAADLAFVGKSGNVDYSERMPWSMLGEMAKVNGLNWGGDWTTLIDRPHVQLAPQPKSEWLLKDEVTRPAAAPSAKPVPTAPTTPVGNPFLRSPYEFTSPNKRGSQRTTDINLPHPPMRAEGFNGPATVKPSSTPAAPRFNFDAIPDETEGTRYNLSGIGDIVK